MELRNFNKGAIYIRQGAHHIGHQPTFWLLLLQATIALCAIVACGVSLSNAAHASQSPHSNTPGPLQSGKSH